MKNLLLTLVVALFATSFAFSQPYNVPNNAPVTGSLVITGNVVAPPIVIAPASATITLGDVAPGESVTFASGAKSAEFQVTCAKGYGISGSVSMNMTHDDASITGEYEISTVNPPVYGTFLPLTETNAPFTVPGSMTGTGLAWAKVNILSFAAAPGADHGARTFTFTLTAQYAE